MKKSIWSQKVTWIKPFKLSKGFISIEMIVALVVLLSILAGVAGRVAQLFIASNSASAASNILSIQTSVQTLRSIDGYGADGANLLTLLQDAQTLPSTLSVSGGKVLNEWGGEVKVVSSSGGQGFSISYANVPVSAASTLVIQLASGGGFSGVKIEGTLLKTPLKSSDVTAALKGKANVALEFMVGAITDLEP